MSDPRERFLAAIAERLGAERIIEVHLFSAIRQGPLETGVAVIAVTPGEETATAEPAALTDAASAGNPTPTHGEAATTEETPDAEVSPYLDEASAHDDNAPRATDVARDRLVVHTARYRLTRKGPDRGKWEFEVSATADAPLTTVDAVARGVTQRSKDLTETERLSGEQLRALLQDPRWRTPTS